MYSPSIDRGIPYMSTRPKSKLVKKGTKNAQPKKKSSLRVSSQSVPLGRAVRYQQTKPSFSNLNSSDGSIMVRHEEFSFDISATSSAFTVVKSLPLNPGNQDIMPWMSRVAPNYESYVFETLEIEYRPLVPATQSGRVYLTVDYDVSDPAPTDKSEFMSMHGAESQSIWAPIVMRCDAKDLKKIPQRFVLDEPVPSGTDARLYNTGNIFIALDGVGSGSYPFKVGEIYVKYKVKLMTPQLGKSADSGSLSVPGAQTVLATPFANTTGASALGTAVKIADASSILFAEKGRYQVDYVGNFTGGAPSTTQPAAMSVISGLANVAGLNGNIPFLNGTVSQWGAIVDVLAAPAQLTMNLLAMAGSATGVQNQVFRAVKYPVGL